MSIVSTLSLLCGCALESWRSEMTAIGLCPRHEGLFSEDKPLSQLADEIMGTLTGGAGR